MSIVDVAQSAGVSVATVSRSFNFPDKVSLATRQRVQAAAQSLRYLPNASAQTLRSHRSRVLGVVLPTLLNPVFAECLAGVGEAAMKAGYSITPLTTDYRVEQERQAVERLLAASVDGVVLVVSEPGSSEALALLQENQVPYVLAYNRHAAHPCVGVDGELAMTELIEHLIALGHRRIGMVSGQLAASDRAQQRWRGFVHGMRKAGLDPEPLIEVPFLQSAVNHLRLVLGSTGRPTALVCSNDLLAIRCLRAAYLAGLHVPRDLSVIGFDGIELGADLAPMLTTVAQPNQLIGRNSVELLASALAANRQLGPLASITLSHQFRAAESCAPPRPPLVQRRRNA